MWTAAITPWVPEVPPEDSDSSLVELRVLDGPNLYFPRAAVKLTLDLSRLEAIGVEEAARFARRIGLANARPGDPGTGFRQRFAARAVARLVRQIATEAGVTRLGVRVRPTTDVSRVVVAFPWRRRNRARALGLAVADVLDALPRGDVEDVVERAADGVRDSEPGERPETLVPKVPVVAVTGTNGKTTTSRMVAHIARTHGLHVGWSSTDGIYVDGELVEAGDYSGPSGAGRVLSYPQVQLAVTETARGGILLRGIGVTHNDVCVVTNVSADHLGMQGIDTVDQLAEVKSVVARITRSDGWAVLNADDPRTLAMRAVTQARGWVFSRDPDSPGVRETLTDGGRATTVIDGWIAVLDSGFDPLPVIQVADVPMTLAGLSRYNLENALAATSVGMALRIPTATVAQGLRTFAPGPDLNPGRMNVYSLGDLTVVVDLAHNEAGLDALLEIMHGLCPPAASVRLALGTAGDRTDDILVAMGATAAQHTDDVIVVHKDGYLRGRNQAQMTELFATGARSVGVQHLEDHPGELAGLQELVERSRSGDVVGVMTHQDREAIADWLATRGATVDGPEELRAKVGLSRR